MTNVRRILERHGRSVPWILRIPEPIFVLGCALLGILVGQLVVSFL